MADDEELTARQKRFIEEYPKDMNGTKACIRAGYSEKGASVQAAQLLANPRVKDGLQEAIAAVSKRNLVTQDWVIQRLLQIAGTDMSEIASWNESGVRFKESSDLSDAARASVQQIEQVMNEFGGGIKIKQYDRIAALKLLGQHLGMFTDKMDVNLSVEARPAKELSDDEILKELSDE